jgi:hypothetical protein
MGGHDLLGKWQESGASAARAIRVDWAGDRAVAWRWNDRAAGEASVTDQVVLRGFDDYDISLGDVLRGERATLGKSLLDVERELRISAPLIAAIEACDVSAFSTPSFIAGYVRSYARYLGLNPDETYARFCAESGFSVAHGLAPEASSPRPPRAERGDPLAAPSVPFIPVPRGLLAGIEPGAVGSALVLVALIAGIGYGGWSVLREVQRVELAPVDQAPTIVAEVAPLLAPGAAEAGSAEPGQADVAAAMTSTAAALEQFYRTEALELPVVVPRDGPIAAIDPAQGAEAGLMAEDGLIGEGDAPDDLEPIEEPVPLQVIAAPPPPVEIMAVRPAWVRVQAADGTTLLEKILDAGERYLVPQAEAPARLRAGNSGAVYFVVNGQVLGPASTTGAVVRNIALSPDALSDAFAPADDAVDPDLALHARLDELSADRGVVVSE